MIKTGSYMFIRGTNMEVGIRRVSKDPEHPYAQCVFRYGRRLYKKTKSKINPRKHIVQKIPTQCLTHKCDFDTKRQTLKQSFQHSTLTTKMPKAEGVFDTELDKDAYDIYPAGGKFLHIIKGPTAQHILGNRKPRSLSIFGIRELTFPFQKFNPNTNIVTFNTIPPKRAHISVVRNTCTMHTVGKHSYRWPHAYISPAYDTRPVEIGYIRGTGIQVSLLIEYPDISYYKVKAKDFLGLWIPNEEVSSLAQHFEGHTHSLEELKPLHKDIYINGLPVPFKAYSRDKQMYAVHELNHWPVKESHINTAPKSEYEYLVYYKFNETAKWYEDYKRRLRQLHLHPIAVV